MTEVTVYETSDGHVIGIEASNHSGFDTAGNDIVCAAITTVFEVVSAGLSDLPVDSITDTRSSDNTRWMIRVEPSELTGKQTHGIRRLFRGGIETLRNIGEQYSNYCSVQTEHNETF